MATLNQSLPEKRSSVWVASSATAAGVLLLGVLIVRELLFPPTALPHPATSASEETSPAAPSVTATPPVRAAEPPRAKPAATMVTAPPPRPAAPEAPAAAKIIAGVVEDPQAFGPSKGFAPPVAKTETFIFNALPPFNSTELKRSKANRAEWELDALHGPRMDDLAPKGGVHEAVTVKDANGTELSTWFLIDSGPLAPALATQSLQTLRVMSQAYVEANPDQFPREVTALVDRANASARK